MGPNGSENFKTLLLQIPAKVFKPVLNFPPNGPHKNTFGTVGFEFMSFNDFFLHGGDYQFTIVPYGDTKTAQLSGNNE